VVRGAVLYLELIRLQFDQKDGENGIRYEITRGVENEVSQTTSWLDSQFGAHQEARMIFTLLIHAAKNHWLQVADFLSNRYAVCLEQSDDALEAWAYPREVVAGLFRELHMVRVNGATRTSLKELTIRDAARMMWSVLRCHKLMDEFVVNKFVGHPRLSGYSLSYLFRHRLTTKHLKTFSTKVEDVKGKLEKSQRDLNQLSTRVNSIKKRE